MDIHFEAEVLGQKVRLSVSISGDGTPDSTALGSIQMIGAREVQRMAEIAGVNVRDQKVYAEERERIRSAPKDRPAITLAAGTKDERQVLVTRGSFEIGGKKVSAAKSGAR